FFMVPDPRTVPDGQAGRFVFGILVAFMSIVLLGPTTLEFWTKTAILGSLVFACAGRFALARLLAPLEEGVGHAGRKPGPAGRSAPVGRALAAQHHPRARAARRHSADAGPRHRTEYRRCRHLGGQRRRPGAPPTRWHHAGTGVIEGLAP